MKILLVEDDPDVLHSVAAGLQRIGLVSSCMTLREAFFALNLNRYQVAVVDLTLPDGDGIQLCKQIREEGSHIPILILTGEEKLERKLEGFAAGADDFLTKPFHMEELTARIQSLLRRPPLIAPEILSVKGLVLDTRTQQVQREGKEIQLRPKQLAILEYLLRHLDQPVRRTELLEELWDGTREPLSNAIDVHIKYLRDQIDRPFSTSLIRTLPGVGYIISSR